MITFNLPWQKKTPKVLIIYCLFVKSVFCILFYFVEFWLDKYDLTTTSFFWKITIRYQMIRTPQSTFLYGNFLCYYCFLVVVVFCLVLLLAWVKKYFFLKNFAYLFLSNALFPFSSWFVTKLLDLQLEIVQRATGRTTETKTEMFLLYHVSPLYAIVIPGVLFWITHPPT